MNARITTATQNVTRRHRPRPASLHSDADAPLTTAPVCAVAATSVGSLIADPGVEDAVQEVDHEVGEQVDEHEQRRDAHHRGAVLDLAGGEDLAADAGQVEDPLDHDRPGHQVAQVD